MRLIPLITALAGDWMTIIYTLILLATQLTHLIEKSYRQIKIALAY